ncbi:MAG: hypothetical protein WBF17_20720, partial [Phycisphaerae bacterium]
MLGGRQLLDLTGFTTYDGVSSAVFSPDSKHLAYVAASGKLGTEGREYCAVIDGKEVGPYKDVGELTFSPDGR